MILGGIAMLNAFNDDLGWLAWRNGTLMTKDELQQAIGPNSIDVTLGSAILVQQKSKGVIDPYQNRHTHYEPASMEKYWLHPGTLVLGVTQERFVTDEPLYPDVTQGFKQQTFFVQKYDGRSTVGRLGVASHITAGFGDYGFKDHWTLELANLGSVPVLLYAGMRIGQISFEAVYQPLFYEQGQHAYAEVSKMPEPKAPKLGKERF